MVVFNLLSDLRAPLQRPYDHINLISASKERLARLAAAILAWFLSSFCLPVVQDLLLANTRFRGLALRAFRTRFRGVLDPALRPPTRPPTLFQDLDYYVAPAAAQTLQMAALHALSAQLQAAQPLPPAQLLPAVSHVLLQTEDRRGGKYLEAVAAALASQLSAPMLPVDAILLASLLAECLGGSPEAHLEVIRSGCLSPGSSGGGRAEQRVRLAWEALQLCLPTLGGPTVVFLRSADALLCSSWEGFHGFMDVWGPKSGEDLAAASVSGGGGSGGAPAAAVLLMAGLVLPETGSALVRGGGENDKDTDREKKDALKRAGLLGEGGELGGGAGEEELSLAALLLGLGRLAEEPRPDARRLLPIAFPTRVKLPSPPSGPVAARHLARIHADEAAATRADNFRRAAAAAAASGVSLPGKGSAVYAEESRPGSGALSREEWSQALAWAVSMETLQRRRDELLDGEEEGGAEEGGLKAAPVEVLGQRGSGGLPPQATGMRRVRSAAKHSGEFYTEGITPESLRKPLAVAVAAAAVAPSAAAALCSVAVEGRRRMRQMLRLVTSPVALARSALALPRSVAAAAQAALLPPATAAASAPAQTDPSCGPLRLGEPAVRYGLAMLRRSGGAPRAAVKTSNQYEKQLLSDVLTPEDLGSGFSDVGALDDAKRALREAVQLPLQRPELFQGGALASPPKGVLLFGPPGTGKTLLARAAAAESGASFLELSLSSVASKWFGDSTRLVRAAFTLADKLAPCVLFVDEVDALLGRRSAGGKEHEASREMKNEFMARWDGIQGDGGKRVVVLGATNRPFDLDDAALRRFSVRVSVGLLPVAARRQILDVVLTGQALGGDVDLNKVAERAEGFSGADLRQLCVAAAMRPVRELVGSRSGSGASASKPAAASSVSPHLEENGTFGVTSDALYSVVVQGALAEAERLAAGSGGGFGDGRPAARAVTAADFDAALLEVGPTVDQDSFVVQELTEWNAKYGSIGQRGQNVRRLSYYS